MLTIAVRPKRRKGEEGFGSIFRHRLAKGFTTIQGRRIGKINLKKVLIRTTRAVVLSAICKANATPGKTRTRARSGDIAFLGILESASIEFRNPAK